MLLSIISLARDGNWSATACSNLRHTRGNDIRTRRHCHLLLSDYAEDVIRLYLPQHRSGVRNHYRPAARKKAEQSASQSNLVCFQSCPEPHYLADRVGIYDDVAFANVDDWEL